MRAGSAWSMMARAPVAATMSRLRMRCLTAECSAAPSTARASPAPGAAQRSADRAISRTRRSGCDGASRLDRELHEAQHRRVQRIVEIGDLLVGAVDRQRVLDQIVGADGKEIRFAGECVGGQRGAGHLDHRAERRQLVRHPDPRRRKRRATCSIASRVRRFRQSMRSSATGCAPARAGRPQHGGKLRIQQATFLQRQADGAQPQRRVRRIRRRVVGPAPRAAYRADIEGAQRYRAPLHARTRLARIRTARLARQVFAVHVKETRCEPGEPHRAVGDRLLELDRQFEIGFEADLDAVLGDAGRRRSRPKWRRSRVNFSRLRGNPRPSRATGRRSRCRPSRRLPPSPRRAPARQAGHADHRRQASARAMIGYGCRGRRIRCKAADAARIHQRGVGRRDFLGENYRAAAQPE